MAKYRSTLEILKHGSSGLWEEIHLARAILSVWKEVLPRGIAEKSWPLGMRGDTLILGVESSLVAQELQLYLPQLLSALARVIPGFAASRIQWEPLPEQDLPLREREGLLSQQREDKEAREFPDLPEAAVEALPDTSPLKPIWRRILQWKNAQVKEKGDRA